jgi:hypothetical protein
MVALPLGLVAFKEGPYPGVTGGFGEQSCRVCHFDNPLNAKGGALAIDAPASYVPGQVYTVVVKLDREDLERGGFEISARFASGRDRGRQAGTWRATDSRVQLVPSVDRTVTFAQHTLEGSRARLKGEQQWTIEWTAPERALAAVQFNAAGNASNGDDSPLGDFIYLAARRSKPQR